MLVLTRKENERIRLGDSIVLTVVRVSGDKVRLGIEAPADVVVLRDELKPRKAPQFERIASSMAASDLAASSMAGSDFSSAESSSIEINTIELHASDFELVAPQ